MNRSGPSTVTALCADCGRVLDCRGVEDACWEHEGLHIGRHRCPWWARFVGRAVARRELGKLQGFVVTVRRKRKA